MIGTHDVTANIRDQLLRKRLFLGLTQRDVADRLGVQQSDISGAENGRSWNDLDHLQRWAEALELQVRIVLLGPADDRQVVTSVNELRKLLVKRRRQMNLTQRQVADRLEFAASSIGLAERGRCWVYLQNLQRWAEVLGMRLEVTT